MWSGARTGEIAKVDAAGIRQWGGYGASDRGGLGGSHPEEGGTYSGGSLTLERDPGFEGGGRISTPPLLYIQAYRP